ncbi:putative RNA-directed DNA polymerase from transposon X-element [Trichonephila clavipes]|nr:putative RNA-directed DNA polymerase from transposon X-element [Trichonephila clavipes]
MAYSDFEKAEAFKDTLEVTFQENVEPYCDDKIEEVENIVSNYFDNFTTLTPPLTSPNEVRGIIKRLQNRKAAGPDHILNIALKYLTLNAITHLTNIYNQCLIKNHFPTQWKQANVVMLPKPNQDHKFSQNYRLISLLSTTAKGAAAAPHMKKFQVIQNKILGLITNAPWYIRNDVIHYDLHMEPISSYITKLARNVFRSIENHDNPIIRAQTMFTYPHPKLKYAYATAKWQISLKPP